MIKVPFTYIEYIAHYGELKLNPEDFLEYEDEGEIWDAIIEKLYTEGIQEHIICDKDLDSHIESIELEDFIDKWNKLKDNENI